MQGKLKAVMKYCNTVFLKEFGNENFIAEFASDNCIHVYDNSYLGFIGYYTAIRLIEFAELQGCSVYFQSKNDKPIIEIR